MSFADDKDFVDEQASASVSRRTFLLTYSQADMNKVPSKESFVKLVTNAFESVKSSQKMKQWACCMEEHQNGGFHYHMCVNLSGPRRWNPIKHHIYQTDNISVNFSLNSSGGYVAAYRYVIKNKPITEVLHSAGHVNLEMADSPKTSKAMKGNSARRKSQGIAPTTPNYKRKRLSNEQVARLMLKENLKSEQELFLFANQRKECGESDLYSFVLSKSPKGLSDLINTTWKIEQASSTLQRDRKSLFEIIQDQFSNGVCVPACDGKWYENAYQVLAKNEVNIYYFAGAMRKALKEGRQKNVNILIVGPTNCGKSFLLNPLELIYKAFVNPATGRYAWIGLDECEEIGRAHV